MKSQELNLGVVTEAYPFANGSIKMLGSNLGVCHEYQIVWVWDACEAPYWNKKKKKTVIPKKYIHIYK